MGDVEGGVQGPEARPSEFRPPALAQIALCSSDLAATVHLYTTALGFADARGEVVSGPRLAQIQEVGNDVLALVWWLVGRTEFLQLELFQHSTPPQRSQPADWRPSDHGWVRWGVAVEDFEGSLARLANLGHRTFTAPTASKSGGRRACFRDPYVGCIVEIMEDSGDLPGGRRARQFDVDPAVVYAAVSVPDLDLAREFFVGTLGLPELPADHLHTIDDERMWGLPDAERDALVVSAGTAYVEVIQYSRPTGRPQPADHRLSDQGMMNAALGYRSRTDLDILVAALASRGHDLTSPLLEPGLPSGGYLHASDGTSLEVLAVPQEFDGATGFLPRSDSNLLKRLHPGQ